MLAVGGAQAQVRLSGYAKNLGIRSSSFFTNEAYLLDVSRLRLRTRLDASSQFHAEVWLDTELLLGSFLGTPDYTFSQGLERTTFLDLDWTVEAGRRHLLRQQLFRAFATLYVGQVQLTAGRQRIAWGTGFAWNPTDLLNPFNPAAIELGEKAGVDAAYASVPLGDFSRIEAVVAPGRRRHQTSAALRASTNVSEYDVAALVGRFREDVVLGGDFAGYVGNAGLRGEAALTFADGGRRYLRAILNADYSFPGGYYALAELYFNGSGTSDKAAYDFAALLRGAGFNVARHYGATSVARAITPLLGASFYSLANFDDRSALVGPALTYSLAEDLELSLAAYFFLGAADTEFGRQAHAFFGTVQYYF